MYVDAPDLSGFKVKEGLIYQAGHTLYLNEHAVTSCSSAPVGIAELGELLIAACDDELLAMLANGQLIERLSSVHGVPSPIERLAVDSREEDATILIGTPEGWYRYSMDALSNDRVSISDEQLIEGKPTSIPANLALSGAITWERFVLDLHAGRWPGVSSTWLMDTVAVLLIVLAISGLGIYFRPQR